MKTVVVSVRVPVDIALLLDRGRGTKSRQNVLAPSLVAFIQSLYEAKADPEDEPQDEHMRSVA